jgi:hypothetical protein
VSWDEPIDRPGYDAEHLAELLRMSVSATTRLQSS